MIGFSPMREAIILAVPVGEENAATQRQVWQNCGLGAESSYATFLIAAVEAGKVNRRKEMRPSGFAWLYWRES